jgi:predicted HTH transcriptional regulator
VLNALAHRDYSKRGDRIRIFAFANRIEIHSPGALGGSMRLDNLLEQRWSRNATLVQGLVALDVIEELGFGLDRMVAAMAAAGLPAPVFREVGNTFVVTLYGPGASLLQAAEVPAPHAKHEGSARKPLSQEERHAWILRHLGTAGSLSLRSAILFEAHGTTTDRRYTLRRDRD